MVECFVFGGISDGKVFCVMRLREIIQEYNATSVHFFFLPNIANNVFIKNISK
jgi:hypothetical protein